MERFRHHSGECVVVDGAKIYYEQTEERDGLPVVFLHGGLGSIEDFLPMIDRMSESFRCIGIDSRGHGKSTLGDGVLNYERLMRDVEAVLSHLCVTACNVVGFSDGGIVGYRLAIDRPGLVKKLVTIGSDWNPPVGKVREIYAGLTAASWGEMFPESVALYERLNPDADFSRLVGEIVSMWLDESDAGYPKARIKSIACRTLFIRGDQDFLVPRSVLGEIDEMLPGAHVFNIPFTGHAAVHEQGEMVGVVIEKFLSE
ncbi:Non-heme chloroperoxidase [Poriferisphaera corsica]|uniref:Non-heme chloroperoxidase n=2 Tax=Poriferisphaera corsica TaxID=2528020 RepID=A0A517YT00_9BACT|nr:Non-heme chloroperoxidase [Poriferisphaera corsica]